MVLKGGVLQFKDTPIEKTLIDILNHETTKIILIAETYKKDTTNAVFIFKIIVDNMFQDKFTRSGPLYIGVPNETVIILKFFVYDDTTINTTLVTNEIETQKALASRAGTQQICPSVLYEKDIEDGTIDTAIITLLQRPGAKIKVISDTGVVTYMDPTISMYVYILYNIQSELQKEFDGLKKNHFFMEFLSCKSLHEFCELPNNFRTGSLATSIDSVPLDIATNPTLVLGLDKDSFKKMALHYITLKLFRLNCIHGDLHASNVYILIDGTNIIILIIDLGNGKIDNLQLKFNTGILDTTDVQRLSAILVFNLKRNFCIRGQNPALHAERLTLLCLKLKQKEDIKTIIDIEIAEMRYFDAAVMINMCVEITGHYDSTFITYLSKIKDIYMPLYCCYKDSETETACNTIIEKGLFSNQGTKRQKRNEYVPAIEGGISFYKKTKLPILMYRKSKKSKKSKKRKNKTKNTKKTRKITRKKRINKANK